MKQFIHILIITILLLGHSSKISAGGVVYLVIGSDTAIWDGMNTATHNNYYNIDLYTNPARNTYEVMDPAFRDQFRDSYGNPLKMTWWMMAGNIFRYATNKNVPKPNIMTLYLMKKYHGDNVTMNGDELTLHYHTFFWSDYDGDGVYWWNQSNTFFESLDDFKFTLAQFLLEEATFPVSFRSGWHYMDNDWQHYLDQRVLPYSLHNDYPAKRTYDDEPIDNIFDWSEAPPTWIPFNPSYPNYQIPGSGNSWNVRSVSFQRTIRANYVDSIFAAAQSGTDQVACLWAHLPEADFPDNIATIDSLAHQMETKYPDVTFKYCTAIEAMQLWRGTADSISPTLTITENQTGDKVSFIINSDEDIFQTQPFVAVKNIYDNYQVAETIKLNATEWRTADYFNKSDLVKVGVTVCDDYGNQSMEFIEYLPSDTFIDNSDSNYAENSGNWMTTTLNSWGKDSRITQLNSSDSVSSEWEHTITKSTYYNFFVQVPEIENIAENVEYFIFKNSIPIDTITFNRSLKPYNWIYLSTLLCNESDEIIVEYRVSGKGQDSKYAVVDVLKISALVKDKELNVAETNIDLNEITVNDTIIYSLTISNYGISALKIFSLSSLGNSIISKYSYPIEIPKMSSVEVELQFHFSDIGLVTDTLLILSDDPVDNKRLIPISANVQYYFTIVDNEDSLNYMEYGEWFTSVATSNGASSRYALLNSTPKASASFNKQLEETGLYEIKYIVPSTVNATDNAIYQISIGNVVIDSVYLDQNKNSGSWASIGNYFLPKDIDITVKVIDSGESSQGTVLRADAVKFQLLERLNDADDHEKDQMQLSYKLEQNYPNPFNPSTTIKYEIPGQTQNDNSHVQLKVYDILGKVVTTLVNKEQPAWSYEVKFIADDLSSGIYFYSIIVDNFSEARKMIYLR